MEARHAAVLSLWKIRAQPNELRSEFIYVHAQRACFRKSRDRRPSHLPRAEHLACERPNRRNARHIGPLGVIDVAPNVWTKSKLDTGFGCASQTRYCLGRKIG